MGTQYKIPEEKTFKWYSSPITYEEKSLDGVPDFIVRGFFTSDNRDKVGDIITREATEKAVAKWKRIGNVRMQHNAYEPIGKVTKIGPPDLQWNEMEFRVVDPKAQLLIREGVLSGLSVGIIVNKAEPIDAANPAGGIYIRDYDLVEVSAVDNFCNEDAAITSHPGLLHTQFSGQRAYIYKAAGIDNLTRGATLDLATNPSEVQTLLFDIEKFTVDEAKKWADEHGFSSEKVDITEEKIRLRQFDPALCDPDTYGTKTLDDGVQAVFCTKKDGKSIGSPTTEKDSPENGSSPCLGKEKSMDNEKDIPAGENKALAEEQPEVPKQGFDIAEEMNRKLDKIIDDIGKALELLTQLANPQPDEEPKEDSATEEKSVEANPEPATETKTVEPEVNKAEYAKVDLTKTVEEVVTRVLGGLKLDERDAKIESNLKAYIEELRNQVTPGKAAMVTEEKQPEKPLDDKAIREERRKLIEAHFATRK